MLVTGAKAATYLSCSAIQGMNIMRMERDDDYLAELLHFLSVFWASVRVAPHIALHVPLPPCDPITILSSDGDASAPRSIAGSSSEPFDALCAGTCRGVAER